MIYHDDSKWDEYLKLISEVFPKHGYYNSISRWNSDPWSPQEHHIIRKEKDKLLWLIPYTRNISVAQIEIEPPFAQGQLNYMKVGTKPKIIVFDPQAEKAVREFCSIYWNKFGHYWTIDILAGTPDIDYE